MTTNAVAVPASGMRFTWARLLGFFATDVSRGVEKMARILANAMVDDEPEDQGVGDPDGYSGLASRGPFDRILLSEMLYAAEEPDEFLRRVAMAELQFLELRRVDPKRPGRIEVLLDTSPTQQGAARLVQLAALTVLARRAEERNVPLAIGLLHELPGSFEEGSLEQLFNRWLRARALVAPSIDDVDAWLDSTTENAKVWIVGADGLSSKKTAMARRVRITETQWNEQGVSEVEARVDHRFALLPIEDMPTAIRMLRGHGLKPRSIETRDVTGDLMRFPRFNGADLRVMARSERNDQLITVAVKPNGTDAQLRRRLHQFSGPVLAAGGIGGRLVALVVVGDHLRVEVKGKKLGAVDAISVPRASFELGTDVQSVCNAGLEPLLFCHGILAKVGKAWFTLYEPATVVASRTIVGAAASTLVDTPRVAYSQNNVLYVDNRAIAGVNENETVFLGAEQSVCASRSASPDEGPAPKNQWILLKESGPVDVLLPGNEIAVGVTRLGQDTALVTRTASGRPVSVHRPGESITRYETYLGAVDAFVHPTKPWLLIEGNDGSFDVIDLEAERRIAAHRSDEQHGEAEVGQMGAA